MRPGAKSFALLLATFVAGGGLGWLAGRPFERARDADAHRGLAASAAPERAHDRIASPPAATPTQDKRETTRVRERLAQCMEALEVVSAALDEPCREVATDDAVADRPGYEPSADRVTATRAATGRVRRRSSRRDVGNLVQSLREQAQAEFED